MDFAKYKLPFASSNFVIWAVVFFIIVGFGNAGNALGINLFGPQGKINYGSGKNYGNRTISNKNQIFGPKFMNFNNGFLGGNGLFLIGLAAIIFLCKDEQKQEQFVEEEQEPIECEEVFDGN